MTNEGKLREDKVCDGGAPRECHIIAFDALISQVAFEGKSDREALWFGEARGPVHNIAHHSS